jgi:uncharacterized protein (TIRG00374 family)
MKLLKEIVAVAITVVIFAAILLNVNIPELLTHLSGSNPFYLAVSILMFVPIVLLKSERWRLLLKKYTPLSLKDSVKYTMASFPYMTVTPSDAGDVVRAVYIKNRVQMTTGLTSIAFEKVLDVLALSIFSLFGLFILSSTGSSAVIVFVFSVAIIIIAGMFFFTDSIKHRFIGRVVGGIFRIVKSDKFKNRIMEIQKFFLHTDSRKTWRCFGITVLIWVFHFLQIYFIFLALGLALTANLLFAFIPISLFIGMLPITIGGIGTRDAALIYFLSPFAPAALILSGAILITFIRVWFIGLAGLPFIRTKT